MKLIMGTRGSALALAQARQTARQIEAAHEGLIVEERVIRTTGDVRSAAPLPEIGGKGVFTLEIEAALLDGSTDFAIHSLKDLPPEMPEGLTLGAVPVREDASDCCVLRVAPAERHAETLSFLPQGAHVGTSSLRRRAQLLHLRPDLRVSDVRGNVDTRLRKLEEGQYDALLLATAGLNRLSTDRGTSLVAVERVFRLDETQFLPAPGQGALAVQCRANDEATLRLLSAVDDYETRAQIEAERAVVRALNAGCTTPLGARAYSAGGLLTMSARVLTLDGQNSVSAEAYGTVEDAEFVGEECAAQLQELGVEEMLK